MFWTLRDGSGNIILQTKTYEDMIIEMMIRVCEFQMYLGWKINVRHNQKHYENRDVRYGSFENEICREKLEDLTGRVRLWWTLRNADGHIVYKCKTFADLIREMMGDSVHLHRDML